jgi:Tol biopolymer transport system component
MIAFASDLTGPGDDDALPQIYLISVDGTARQRVTEMEQGACQPAWSPDGKRLAFISPCASNQEIYDGSSIFIINIDGSGLTPIVITPEGDFDPAWSPDGTRIAFTSLRDSHRAQIYVINLEDNSVQSISNNLNWDVQPSWSPDGEKLAFGSNVNGNMIWTMNVDGSGDPTLFSHSGDLKNSHPAWSPDGKYILFTQRRDLSSIPRMVTGQVRVGDHSESPITTTNMPRREGSFSPDSKWIAYEGWPEGDNHDIFIMTLNGLDPIRITNDAAYDFDAAWQPAPGTP